MRISDWSSDMCSSDLQPGAFRLYGIGIAKAVDDDVGALGGQCFRVTQPDPRCGPSDKRRLALQHHAFSSLECSCPLKPSSCASASRFAPGGTRRHRWPSLAFTSGRSEERRGGKECGSTDKYRG